MILFNFKCADGHIHEAFVKLDEVRERPCPTCGKMSSTIISPVKIALDPISGHFPGATMKWAKDRQKKIKHERKVADS